MCGLGTIQNKYKLVYPILFFEVCKDVGCTIIPFHGHNVYILSSDHNF